MLKEKFVSHWHMHYSRLQPEKIYEKLLLEDILDVQKSTLTINAVIWMQN
jgi:hypothetical protein